MLCFRPADAADLDVLFEMNRTLIEQYEDLGSIDLSRVLLWVRRKLEEKLPEYRAVFRNDEKVGYFRLFETDEGALEIDDLYILSPFRGQGVGTEIIRHCIAESERLQKPLMLYVFTRNIRAAALYERMGFVPSSIVSPTRQIMVRSCVAPLE